MVNVIHFSEIIKSSSWCNCMSLYRLRFECRYKGGVLSTHATRTSRSTGETASHYQHLEFE